MTDNNKEYQRQQVRLLECICLASHGELLTVIIKLLTRCQKEDLVVDGTKNHSTLYTTDIYDLLNSVLDPKERDTQ